MKIKFLGTGTSTGVPEIGCECKVCTSNDIKDRRLRASVLLTVSGKRILIDCGPDFRQQMLNEEFRKLDAVLLTHEHYDHVGGLDDLRPYCRMGDIDIYANDTTLAALKRRIPYCFSDNPYPGVPTLKVNAVPKDKPFDVAGVKVQPIEVMHYKLSIYGYRIGNFAYLTDVKTIPEEEYNKLENVDILVLDALRIGRHHISHQTLEEALVMAKRIAAKKTYLIHMSHEIGMHEDTQKQLPANVYLAYDGLELNLD